VRKDDTGDDDEEQVGDWRS